MIFKKCFDPRDSSRFDDLWFGSKGFTFPTVCLRLCPVVPEGFVGHLVKKTKKVIEKNVILAQQSTAHTAMLPYLFQAISSSCKLQLYSMMNTEPAPVRTRHFILCAFWPQKELCFLHMPYHISLNAPKFLPIFLHEFLVYRRAINYDYPLCLLYAVAFTMRLLSLVVAF